MVVLAGDRASRLAVGTYTAWVVGYDVPWTYQLWRLIRAPSWVGCVRLGVLLTSLRSAGGHLGPASVVHTDEQN